MTRRSASKTSGRALRLKTPRVYLPLLTPSRYKGAFGGRGSGKSHAFAELLIERCLMMPGTRAVCVREVQRSLEQSVKRLLDDKIRTYGLEAQLQSSKAQIATPGGGVIIFQGMQDHTAESIKSLEGFDVAWVEEAQALSKRSLDLLRPTIRKPDSEIWFSWNPRNATDPVDVFLRGATPAPDSVVLRVNWSDNPWFPDVLRRELEWDQAHDPDKYAHIWLGEYEQHSEARVFRNVRVDEFETPSGLTFYFGCDWGFSIDPTVLMRCWLEGRTLFIDHEAFEIGCEIEDTPALFDTLECGCSRFAPCGAPGHAMARAWPITADSARPETISHMRRHGYPNIEPATKGSGSVEEGVAFLQGYEIVVHRRCRHTIDEFTLYHYKTDPVTGRVLPILSQKKNHVIDSARYAVERVRRVSGALAVEGANTEGLAARYGRNEGGLFGRPSVRTRP